MFAVENVTTTLVGMKWYLCMTVLLWLLFSFIAPSGYAHAIETTLLGFLFPHPNDNNKKEPHKKNKSKKKKYKPKKKTSVPSEPDQRNLPDQLQQYLEENNQWWRDLAPPFSFSTDEDDDFCEGARSVSSPKGREPDIMHFVFLVHGHRGFSNDLSYLQTVMEHTSGRVKRKQWTTTQGASSVSPSSTTGTTAQKSTPLVHDMVIHSAICNERKTTDGILNGGERLVQEMITVIRKTMWKQSQIKRSSNQQNQDRKSVV